MMNIDDKLSLINKANDYALNFISKQDLLNSINLYIEKYGDIDDISDVLEQIIDLTGLYGFEIYNKNEVNLENNIRISMRKLAFAGKQLKYLNIEQLEVLEFIEKNQKIMLSAPTSFGKTSIVLEYILRNYLNLNDIIFIVPTNSLAEEIYMKLLLMNKTNMNNKFSISTSAFKKAAYDILILTPEKYLNLSENMKNLNISLIVMDEIYKILEKNINCNNLGVTKDRSHRFRRVIELVSRLNLKLILLSPYTFEKDVSMKDFLSKYNIAIIDKKIEYVIQAVTNVSGTKEIKEVFGADTKMYGYKSRTNIPDKASILLECLKEENNIVYVPDVMTAYSISNKYLSKISKTVQNDARYNAFLNHLRQNYNYNNDEEWEVTRAIERNVGIYVAPMPRYIKREIIDLYNKNMLKNLIATSAFIEGVNSNAKNLIVTSTCTGGNVRLGDIDILNMLGRTGRFGKHPKGNVITISKAITQTVKSVKEKSSIIIGNPNYKKNNGDEIRESYDIENMDIIYLSDNEILKVAETKEMALRFGLNESDLHIALNLPNEWKLKLYNTFFYMNSSEIEKTHSIIKDIEQNKGNFLEGVEYIFKLLNNSNIEIQYEFGTLPPFTEERFNWGKKYILYINEPISTILKQEKAYINRNKFKEYNRKYFKKNGSFNYIALYIATFKFLSNVVEYRIPLYINFFISVFKLYLAKNPIYNFEEIDTNKVSLQLENPGIDVSYQNMIDFGLPKEMIKRINDNNLDTNIISNENIEMLEYLDEFEKILLMEFKLYY